MLRYRLVVALVFCLVLIPSLALADAARVQSMGGVSLFQEDSSLVFTNPSLIGNYSNRAWFSLGVTGGDGLVGIDPHGGAAVSIPIRIEYLGDLKEELVVKGVVTLGVVLNRSPSLYGFDAAIWPVAEVYLPDGPGGPLQGAAGPVEQSEPLRFPLDLFVGFGDQNSKFRFGMNFYYAGGSSRVWDIDDSDQDDLQQETIVRTQSHLFNATLGFSGGTRADRVRPEAWFRVGNLASWHDAVSTTEIAPDDTDTLVDTVLALDRDLRLGGGFRILLGNAEEGLVVSPGVSYDFATGAFRFDDNLVTPNSADEHASRAAMAHDLKAGLGLSWRGDGLLVQGSEAFGMRVLQQTDIREAGEDEFLTTATVTYDLAAPELSIGAEYELLPVLVVRAGLRSSVVGGRSSSEVTQAIGSQDSPTEFAVTQTMASAPVAVAVDATAGLGLKVKRFRLDAIIGGAFLGEETPNLLSRVDMSFSFD